MTYPKLSVKWSEGESATYFVNMITAGFDRLKKVYWLKSFSGTYYFDYRTKKVTLDTGVEIRDISVLEWSVLA